MILQNINKLQLTRFYTSNANNPEQQQKINYHILINNVDYFALINIYLAVVTVATVII